MRVVSKRVLKEFWVKYPRSEQPLKAWHSEAMHSTWATPQDIKNVYASASFVAGNRVVFNIHGNDYRLVAGVDYRRQALFIKFIGTHAEYDRINVEKI